MKQKDKLKSVVEKAGGSFSRSLGIELRQGKSEEIFKWFLASILFGARIGEGIAIKTYEEFDRRGVITPQSILETAFFFGFDSLVVQFADLIYVSHMSPTQFLPKIVLRLR